MQSALSQRRSRPAVRTALAAAGEESRPAKSACARDDAVAASGEVLTAVADLAGRFLAEPDWQPVMPEALERLGRAARVSRVYLFEAHRDGRRLLTSQRHEWCAPGIAPQIDNPDLQNLQFTAAGLDRWPRLLRKGKPIAGTLDNLPRRERAILAKEGILSIAVVPVFVDGAWWGQIGFDDCAQARAWSSGEIDALRAAAALIGSAIGHARAGRELADARETARTFQDIVNRSPAIAYRARAEADFPIEFVSDNVSRMGYSVEEFLTGQTTFEDIVHPDDFARLVQATERHFEAGRDEYTERYRILDKRGGVHWVEDRTTVQRDPEGNPTHFEGLVIDVTAGVQAELLLDNALAAIATPVFVKDAAHRFVVVNEALASLLGRTRDELIGHADREFLPAAEVDPFWREDDKVLRTGETSVQLESITDAEGRERTILTTKSRFTGAGGEPYLIGSIADITELDVLNERLGERVKELDCLHQIQRLRADMSLDVEELLSRTVPLLPPAMLVPEAACARIRLGRRSWRSERFRATEWKLACDIVVAGCVEGAVEVFYRRKLPERDNGPFLAEEHDLIAEIASGLALGIEQRRGEAERIAREREFRQLFDAANDALVILDRRGRIVAANAAAGSMSGYGAAELVGRSARSLTDRASRDDLDDVLAGRGAAAGQAIDGAIVPKGGTPLPVSTVGTVIDYRGAPHVMVALRDISARKAAELRSARASRALRVLYKASGAVLEAADEHALMERICRIVVKEGGYHLAWVGFAEDDPAKTIQPVASAGFEKGYLERLQLTWANTARGRGPSGTAIRTGKPAVARDIEHGPKFAPWRADALARGYRSSYVVPFTVPNDHDARGQIAIYAAEPDAFDEEESGLLQELGASLARGISQLRTREALSDSKERYRSLVEGMNDGLVVVEGRDQIITFANRRISEMLGFNREELLGRRSIDMFPKAEQAKVRAQIARRRRGEQGRYEVEIPRKDGTVMQALLSVRPQRDQRGRTVGAVAVVTDMTALKEARKTIADLARFPRENPAPVIRFAADGRLLYTNPAARALLPDSGSEGLRFTRESWDELLKVALGARRGTSREFTCGKHTYSFRIVPVPKEGYVNIYAFDVTERARAAQEISAANARLEKIFDGVQVYIWDEDLSQVFIELEGLRALGVGDLRRHLEQNPDVVARLAGLAQVNDVNEAGLRLLGIKSRKALGRKVDTLLPPEPIEVFVEQLCAIWDGRSRFEDEVALQLGGGRTLAGVLSMPVPASVDDAKHVPVSIFDITERKAAEREIEYLARYDALTGLPNRDMFVDRLGQAMARARRGGEGFAVLLLDLDHFKDVNDTRGHMAGDRLLEQVGKRLAGLVRETDTVSRFGGDEFGVVQTDLRDPEGAAGLAAKIVDAMAEPYMVDGSRVDSTVSIGIAVWSSETDEAENLMRRADMALYRAKAEGRDTFRFHTAEMDTVVRTRVETGADLRQGLERDELFVVYQPQVDARTGRVSGAEALVRWNHPQRGLVSPAEFIPIAELSGLILPLGRWILRTACRQMRAWLDADTAPPVLAVNLSGVQFRAAEFEAELDALIDEYRIPPHRLELELTESVFMETTVAHREFFDRLRARHVRIAIDDFGTGYSSLQYLIRFPVDRIKIDQTFVAGITDNTQSAAVVSATISLARELGIDVIAEGVETEEQLAFLRERGCHEIQGFYFGKPCSADELAGYLEPLRSGEPATC